MPKLATAIDPLMAAPPQDIVSALLDGRLSEPFQYLGLHELPDRFGLTVFAPGAQTLTCLTGKSTKTPMTAVPHADGLFCTVLDKA